jgi:hypothetical protein
LFEADKIANNSGDDAWKMEFGPVLSEDEALIKKQFVRKSMIK